MTNFRQLFSKTQRAVLKKTIGERIVMAKNAYELKAYEAASYDIETAKNTIRFLWLNDFYFDDEYFALDKIVFDLYCKIRRKKDGR